MIEKESKTINIEILEFIHNNPKQVVLEPKRYANVLTFAFPDDCYHLDLKKFPKMRLQVTHLSTQEVMNNQPLLNHFYSLTAQQNENGFSNVWLTTAHLKDCRLAMVEISFES